MISTPIGVFGGTFDPIHCGHLAVAEYLSQQGLTEIQFVPCLSPPHRQQPHANPMQRLEMIRLAVHHHPGWVVNDVDFQRPGPSYMVDTLTILRQQRPQTPWCLILGMDAFLHFNQWRQWEKILTLAHLIVVNRPGFSLPGEHWSKALLKQRQAGAWRELNHSLAGRILIAEMPPAPISATAIRQHATLDLENALPDSVLHYIRQHHLYNH